MHHGDESLLGRPPRLEEAGEVAALPQLWDLEFDAAGARLPEALSVAVPAIRPVLSPLAVGGPGPLLDLELHEPIDDVCQELADDVVPGPLLNELRK